MHKARSLSPLIFCLYMFEIASPLPTSLLPLSPAWFLLPTSVLSPPSPSPSYPFHPIISYPFHQGTRLSLEVKVKVVAEELAPQISVILSKIENLWHKSSFSILLIKGPDCQQPTIISTCQHLKKASQVLNYLYNAFALF